MKYKFFRLKLKLKYFRGKRLFTYDVSQNRGMPDSPRLDQQKSEICLPSTPLNQRKSEICFPPLPTLISEN